MSLTLLCFLGSLVLVARQVGWGHQKPWHENIQAAQQEVHMGKDRGRLLTAAQSRCEWPLLAEPPSLTVGGLPSSPGALPRQQERLQVGVPSQAELNSCSPEAARDNTCLQF